MVCIILWYIAVLCFRRRKICTLLSSVSCNSGTIKHVRRRIFSFSIARPSIPVPNISLGKVHRTYDEGNFYFRNFALDFEGGWAFVLIAPLNTGFWNSVLGFCNSFLVRAIKCSFCFNIRSLFYFWYFNRYNWSQKFIYILQITLCKQLYIFIIF